MGMTSRQDSKPRKLLSPILTIAGDRSNLTIQIGLLASIIYAVVGIALGSYAWSDPVWQRIALAAIQAVAWLVTILALLPFIRQNSIRVYLLIFSLLLLMGGMALFVEGQVITSALVTLVFTIILTSVTIRGQAAEHGLTFGAAGAWLISLAGQFSPFEKIPLPGSDLAFATMLGVFVMVYVTLLAMEYVTATLRLRLILGSLVITVLPLLVVSLFQAYLVQDSMTERLSESLSSAADQTAFRVDDLLSSNRDLVSLDTTLPILAEYLSVPATQRIGSPQEKDLLLAFEVLNKRPHQFLVAYGLLDYLGRVVYDINPAAIGYFEASSDYYSEAIRGNQYISNIEYSEQDEKPYLYFSAPVRSTTGGVVGILRAKYDAGILQYILQDSSNLVGQNTFPMLVDENQMRLGDMYNASNVFKTLGPLSETQAMELKSTRRISSVPGDEISTNLSALSQYLSQKPLKTFFTVDLDPENRMVHDMQFMAVTPLKNKPWLVLYTQDTSALSELAASQERSTTLIATLLAGFVALFSTVFARALTQPITNLTNTARKITEGDLSVNAPVSNDEIGTLANAFNIMTGRLRQSINELEDRVRARTSELAERNETLTYRNRQIQTISEVARSIASSQNLNTLLSQVTQMVSYRFGFYHVGIFLLDDAREYAILRAANSEGGKRMLARQHKLAVGQSGIVGHVTSNAKARIATDVGTDAIFFNNPDLPLTRSEMALPLISSGQVIGALDVQSTQSNAFTDEEVELFSTLADQVAIAIINSRSFEATQRALDEARLIHQQYLMQEWNREVIQRIHPTYEYTSRGVVARDRVVSPEIDAILNTGEAIIQNASSEGQVANPAVLGVPIKLRGETIGIIHLQDGVSPHREWVEDEVQIVQSIADQVAQALENVRLFEQTVRRADRDRKVLEITGKIRGSNDPKKMIQIAVEELQRELHASKTQVILDSSHNYSTNDHSKVNGFSNDRSNGNGKKDGHKGDSI